MNNINSNFNQNPIANSNQMITNQNDNKFVDRSKILSSLINANNNTISTKICNCNSNSTLVGGLTCLNSSIEYSKHYLNYNSNSSKELLN